MPIIGNRYYGNLGEELNYTDMLVVTGSGITDTIPAAGANQGLLIRGFIITEFERDTMTLLTPAKLKFETSGKQLWSGVQDESGRKETHITALNEIDVYGGKNEVLTLTNATYGAGLTKTNAIVFFDTVYLP